MHIVASKKSTSTTTIPLKWYQNILALYPGSKNSPENKKPIIKIEAKLKGELCNF